MTKWQRHLYQPPTPIGEDGGRVTASDKHVNLARLAAAEGMVLLKNNGTLPLEKGTKVVLLGKACVDYVKGGGGSGDVTTAYVKSLYDGLKEKEREGKIAIFEELIDFYKKDIDSQYAKGYEPGITHETMIPNELIERACKFSDTAIVSISRYSGEGWDRLAQMSESDSVWKAVVELAKRQAEVYPDGDFNLTNGERAMIEVAVNNFKNVVVVLNIGGMMETQWFASNDDIGAALLAWQGGMEGGRATADILVGDNYPSGRLSDTFAASLEDYPSTEGFHDSMDYAEYTEDIYVGYRYFNTISGAEEKVVYPFGYGMSYTNFSLEVISETILNEVLHVEVKVSNIGDRPGKEVVQLYYSAPNGALGKPARELGAFTKTDQLGAGDSQVLHLELPVSQMASYDDSGKVNKSSYVLEKGVYRFMVGVNAKDVTLLDTAYELNEDVIVKQLTSKLAPRKLTKRMLSDGSMEMLTTSDYEKIPMLYERIGAVVAEAMAPEERFIPRRSLLKPTKRNFIEVVEGTMTLDEFMDQLSIEELIHLLGGQRNRGLAVTFGIGDMPDYGIPEIMTCDGPAGVRIPPQMGVTTTSWPCSTMLACTFNPSIAEEIGRCVAMEVKENNLGVWLAPAVNIHRSPLCGRNFEYYSEDPYLAGKIGAGMVRGVQSQNIGSTVKHFALNNKETNRKNSDSRVSERAAREIYLKPFEIIVKEADPWCIMTSYNKINGTYSSENKELIEGILREEWGYDGMVMTDWWTAGEHYLEARAGNDLKMANGYPDRVMHAYEQGEITAEEIRKAAKNILNLILKME